MSIASEYERQFQWRDWHRVLEHLPSAASRTVLDLGCGVGDLATEFSARGARVIAVDVNRELLEHARARNIPNVDFRFGDLRTTTDFGVTADGIWCSLTAAYLPDLPAVLTRWAASMKPGGWIALTEIDDLFRHEPVSEEVKDLLAAFVEEAFTSGRYDFRMGRKLSDHLKRSGFAVSEELTLDDAELSFDGPASSDVLEAWRLRFDRMQGLRAFCGPHMERVREEFLSCLQRPDHRSLTKVVCCIAHPMVRITDA